MLSKGMQKTSFSKRIEWEQTMKEEFSGLRIHDVHGN